MATWKHRALGLMAAVGAAAGFSAPAMADDGLPFDLTGGATFLNDYRLRGASLSDTKPVLQGSVEASVPLTQNLSAFAGAWGSSLDKDAGAGAMETDLYGGLQGNLGKLGFRVRYLRLVFHDVQGLDFDQYEGKLTAPLGPVDMAAGVIRDERPGPAHSTYVYTSGSVPIAKTGFAVKALVGYEDGTFWDSKVNWSLGASFARGHFIIGADYIDTNKFAPASNGDNRAGATVVGYIGARF